MLDIKLIRTNPELVKENIKKKFQDQKIELVDKVIELDKQFRETKLECDNLRNMRNVKSKEIGGYMKNGQKDEAEKVKAEVAEIGKKLEELDAAIEQHSNGWKINRLGKTELAILRVAVYELLFDDEISGASLTTGKDLKLTLQAGRYDMTGSTNNAAVKAAGVDAVTGADINDTASMQSVGLQYGKDKLSLGAAYHNLESDNFKNYSGYTNSGSKSDEANIWAVNGKYTFDKNVALGGTYAENTEADDYKKAGSVELDYKGAQPANKGTWGAYTAYRHLGQNVALDPSYDGAWAGTKGWEIGTNYTLAKNTLASVKYFNGEKLGNGKDAEKLFGRVEFKF